MLKSFTGPQKKPSLLKTFKTLQTKKKDKEEIAKRLNLPKRLHRLCSSSPPLRPSFLHLPWFSSSLRSSSSDSSFQYLPSSSSRSSCSSSSSSSSGLRLEFVLFGRKSWNEFWKWKIENGRWKCVVCFVRVENEKELWLSIFSYFGFIRF